jgi:hypothetical protein
VGEGKHPTNPQILEGPASNVYGGPLAAVRMAIKAAIDAGDLDLASKLLDVVRAAPKPARVAELPTRRT